MMEVGIFTPIGNNGWLISENSPQYMPSFDLNREIALKAEKYGVDFLLSMIKLRGFGGKTEFWEYNLESFTLMAGLAAITEEDQDLRDLPDPGHPARLLRADVQHDRFDQPRPLRAQPDHRLAAARIQPDGAVAGRRAFPQPLHDARRICPHPARALGDRQSRTSRANITRWTIAGSSRCPPAT